MGCGSCSGSRRKPSAGSTTTTYTVTWGDGKRSEFKTIPAARVAMAQETDPARRRGMYMTAKSN